MKTIIVAVLLCGFVNGQTKCDSLAIEYRHRVADIQKNFFKSNEAFEVGCGLICSGLWVNLIAVTGRNQDFINKDQFRQFMIVATIIQAAGIGVVFYSHTYINKATLSVSPTKIIYTFK